MGRDSQDEPVLGDETGATIQQLHCDSLEQDSQDNSGEQSEPDDICSACGKPFSLSQLDDTYPDRCDKCGKWSHTECLLMRVDLQGEWSLCAACDANAKSVKV